jgi:molybdopterin molybdotransferase
MEIEIQITAARISERILPPYSAGAHGAWLEFRGVVRAEENGRGISALEYEAYPEMAEREMRRILESLSVKLACIAVKVIHRIGIIPVGETAIYVGVAAAHRGEALALVTEFMNHLKRDVPVWKTRALPDEKSREGEGRKTAGKAPRQTKPLSFEEAMAEIQSRTPILPGMRAPLSEIEGRVLRETVHAPDDVPNCDRSTRDGYAVLRGDSSDVLCVVDALSAADWKPRQLKPGEAVRVATGSAMPGGNLRVIMQEDVERDGDKIKIIQRRKSDHVRRRGEEIRAGEPILQAGTVLNAGALALLATVGCAHPLVSPRLSVVHFTTGDEIISPDQTPKPGQIRDSNSILIRSLLQRYSCDIVHGHLRENLEEAKQQVALYRRQIETANVLLISGGASVGEKDFSRDLMEHFGYEIIFNRLNIRPGAPLIFGVNHSRVAFGLPGNPGSHFVCFHLFVAAALRALIGHAPQVFSSGVLASRLDDEPNSRKSFLPARWDPAGLFPSKWLSSGDVTCLVGANALIRVPPNSGPMEAGTKVDFLPI